MPCHDRRWQSRLPLARAQRAVEEITKTMQAIEAQRYESGLSDYASYLGISVHVPTFHRALLRRRAWHQEWLDYGLLLRSNYRRGNERPSKLPSEV